MFSLISKASANDTLPLIIEHLTNLEANLKYYSPSLNTEEYDWIRNPFIEISDDARVSLTLTEEEELAFISTDGRLKIKYMESSLEKFCILIREYQSIAKKALAILMQFSTSYLCELGFSTLTSIKRKKRTNLQSIDEEIRVCLSYICPNIGEIAKTYQAHTSHQHEIE